MIDTIHYEGDEYPSYQACGNAARYILPFALEVCRGKGCDVGCMKNEWAFPESMPIDLSFDDGYHALNLPVKNLDYIFSSHCLEHIPKWVDVLDYWYECLKVGGVLFLYLPDYSQKYWRPWNNRKHVNIFTPEIIEDYMKHRGFQKIKKSGVDLNNSFSIFGEKS